jgi:hypothetical protein
MVSIITEENSVVFVAKFKNLTIYDLYIRHIPSDFCHKIPSGSVDFYVYWRVLSKVIANDQNFRVVNPTALTGLPVISGGAGSIDISSKTYEDYKATNFGTMNTNHVATTPYTPTKGVFDNIVINNYYLIQTDRLHDFIFIYRIFTVIPEAVRNANAGWFPWSYSSNLGFNYIYRSQAHVVMACRIRSYDVLKAVGIEVPSDIKTTFDVNGLANLHTDSGQTYYAFLKNSQYFTSYESISNAIHAYLNGIYDGLSMPAGWATDNGNGLYNGLNPSFDDPVLTIYPYLTEQGTYPNVLVNESVPSGVFVIGRDFAYGEGITYPSTEFTLAEISTPTLEKLSKLNPISPLPSAVYEISIPLAGAI